MTADLAPMRWWHIDEVLPLERDLFGAERWSARMFWSELGQHESRHYLVAVEADEVLGYGGLCAHGVDAYVQTLGVRRDRQRQGLGTALLDALLAEADRRGSRTVGLEVRADNVRAQRLYAAHDFAAVGLRRGYYQPSGTDAVVMVRDQAHFAGSRTAG